jgi:hypothetical protein
MLKESINTPPLSRIAPQSFDLFIGHMKTLFGLLPDSRSGHNKSYKISDAALSAFSVFFTQSPSFLSYQQAMQETKGKNNAESLFQVTNIPSDNQVRNLLDPINPSNFAAIFELGFDYLSQNGYIEPYRNFNNTLLLSLDGLCYHSSKQISCDKCYQRQHKDGSISYSHNAITPVIVAPGNPHVISMMPEFITPQDGDAKQDSEHKATKRWLERNASKLRALNITCLGDDLNSRQPLCEAMLAAGCHFLLVCKPDSHKALYETLEEQELEGNVNILEVPWKHGKKKFTNTYRFVNKLPLREGDDALTVNWCELVTTDMNGKCVYKNTFITDHFITKDNVEEIILAGRTRWKGENENNNTLKTKGYNLNHNFGHGKQYLSQTLFTLNIIAFMLHTILHMTDQRYKIVRDKLPTRKIFFDDIRALTRYMYFDNWQQLLEFMMRGLEITPPNTS